MRQASAVRFSGIQRGVGAANATLDIAVARAGVSKGGLLYHFPSRSDLFAGLCDRLAEAIDMAIAEAPDDPVGLIRWYLSAAVDVVVGENTLWLGLSGANHAVDDDVAALPGEHVRLVGDGLYFNALVGGPLPDPDHLEQITDTLVRGISSTPERPA